MKDIPIVRLIGETEENFYQLGLKDRHTAKALIHQSKRLIKTPWEQVNLLIEKVSRPFFLKILKKNKSFRKHILAYAEGLQIMPEDIAMASLMPEMASFMDKWLPGLSTGLFGCSSFFTWDEQAHQLIHGTRSGFSPYGYL